MQTTNLLVMSLAPPALSGTVFAAMNALRQTGMTMGGALLGALMTQHATSALTDALGKKGMLNAAVVASETVSQHRVAMMPRALQGLYTHAMESGFHWAMLCASLSCVLALSLIARLAHHAHQ